MTNAEKQLKEMEEQMRREQASQKKEKQGRSAKPYAVKKESPSAGIVSHRAGAAGRRNLLGAELFRCFVLLGQPLGRIREQQHCP